VANVLIGILAGTSLVASVLETVRKALVVVRCVLIIIRIKADLEIKVLAIARMATDLVASDRVTSRIVDLPITRVRTSVLDITLRLVSVLMTVLAGDDPAVRVPIIDRNLVDNEAAVPDEVVITRSTIDLAVRVRMTVLVCEVLVREVLTESLAADVFVTSVLIIPRIVFATVRPRDTNRIAEDLVLIVATITLEVEVLVVTVRVTARKTPVFATFDATICRITAYFDANVFATALTGVTTDFRDLTTILVTTDFVG